ANRAATCANCGQIGHVQSVIRSFDSQQQQILSGHLSR
ncbi:MAG: hypothetical protein KA368_17325, partial [Acidobacteria bacterium]|nr:hypothetical protein [Acidobacteriota bacterium]